MERLHRLGTMIRMSSTARLESRIRPFSKHHDYEDYFYDLAFQIVKWKFPSASGCICDHLAASIKFRRQSLRYQLQQQRKVDPKSVCLNGFESAKPRTAHAVTATAEAPHAHRRQIFSASSTSTSTFEILDFHHHYTEPSRMPNKPLSSPSVFGAAPIVQDCDNLPYPQPPTTEEGTHALCYMCSRELSGQQYNDNSWWR